MSSTTPREQAIIRAKSFCEAFALESTVQILATHFSKNVIIFEHGPSTIDELPFIGREFRGLEGLDLYLKLVRECLVMKKLEFEGWSCDTQAVVEGAGGTTGITVVTVKGSGEFQYKDTSKRWAPSPSTKTVC